MEQNGKIKFLRKQIGLSQKELADKTGVAQATINKLENGSTANPQIDIAIKLSRVLNSNVYEIFGSEAIPYSNNDIKNLKFQLLDSIESYFSRLFNEKYIESKSSKISGNEELKKYREHLNIIRDGLIDNFIDFGIFTKKEITQLWNEMNSSGSPED